MLNFHSFKIWRDWRWQHNHRVQPVTELTHSFLKFQLKYEENKSTYTPRYHQKSVERSIGGWSHHTVISTFKLYSESSHTFLSRMYGTNIDYRRLSLQPLYRCVFVNLCACVSVSVYNIDLCSSIACIFGNICIPENANYFPSRVLLKRFGWMANVYATVRMWMCVKMCNESVIETKMVLPFSWKL